jgi:hypothetical protein
MKELKRRERRGRREEPTTSLAIFSAFSAISAFFFFDDNLTSPKNLRSVQKNEEGTTKDAKGTKDKARKSSVFICVRLWLISFVSFLSRLCFVALRPG